MTGQHAQFGFSAPAKLLNANQRMHYMERAGLVKQWRNATMQYGRSMLGTPLPRFDRARIDIHIGFTTNRVRDIGNYAPTAKAIVDALVEGRGKVRGLGLLPDDSDQYLDGPHLHNAGRVTGVVPWVVVELTGLQP